MKKALFILAFWVTYLISNGQSISLQVVVSSGDFFSSPSGSLAWSLGEILTETYQQTNNSLTQGFHQPETSPVTGFEKGNEIALAIYPNPTIDLVNVKISQNGTYQFDVLDLHGRKLNRTELTIDNETLVYEINLKDFAPAIYLLKITNIRTGRISFFKIEKI